ncbi:MAG TPA: TrmH family RNA methyltransferase [Actinomycetota bacterium]
MAERFHAARRDPSLTVIEGFHAVKHAVRFGAEILEAATLDVSALSRLAGRLAPDVVRRLASAEEVDVPTFESLVPSPPRSGVVAIARRRVSDPAAMLADPAPAPVVLLESPRRAGNVGAAIRSAAAAGASGVIVTGDLDPWHPAALRGSAGLHFALPVARVEELPRGDRPLVALDPGGERLGTGSLPARALLAFGTEREGLSDELRGRADLTFAIPMRPGVSSLNLGAAVAVTLYAWRLARA